MKTKILVMSFLLVSGMTFARVNRELDSLRRLVLAPKIEKYQKQVAVYAQLMRNTNDKVTLKYYAKQIIDLSKDLQDDIKEIYGFRVASVVNPVYVGQNVQTVFYPNMGGFIFPVTTVKTGSLPNLYDELSYIKDYAWRIRIMTKAEVVKKNLSKLDCRNDKLAV